MPGCDIANGPPFGIDNAAKRCRFFLQLHQRQQGTGHSSGWHSWGAAGHLIRIVKVKIDHLDIT